MLVLRALEATVSKDAPATPLQGKTILHRGHFVLLSYLSLSCIYLNMVKCLIGGREFFGCFFLYLFYVQQAPLHNHLFHTENKYLEAVSKAPGV